MTTLITLAQYKSFKGITSTTYDNKLTSLVNSVNKIVTEYCNRTFIDYYGTAKVEYFDGVNSSEIYPVEFPIRDVTKLETSIDGGVTYAELVENTDYFIDKSSDRIVSSLSQFVISTIPTNSLKLTYRGGYPIVPDDISMACVSLVEYYYEEQYTPRKTLQGATLENTLYTADTGRLPPHIRRILDMHRAINV